METDWKAPAVCKPDEVVVPDRHADVVAESSRHYQRLRACRLVCP